MLNSFQDRSWKLRQAWKRANAGDVGERLVFRAPRAYILYDLNYEEHLESISRFLKTIDNMQTIGRRGMHQYYNQGHSMIAAMQAVENLFGADHDLWRMDAGRLDREDSS